MRIAPNSIPEPEIALVSLITYLLLHNHQPIDLFLPYPGSVRIRTTPSILTIRSTISILVTRTPQSTIHIAQLNLYINSIPLN